jgi:hypothetical protein
VTEEDAASGCRHGKCSGPGVPHKGWKCVGLEDFGAPSQTCEMCEIIPIRFVHEMEHPDYPGKLCVGCVCAGHMEEDYAAPKERERVLRQKARRRQTWSDREWRTSGKGNSYLNTEGFNVVIFPLGRYWKYRIENRRTEETKFSHSIYLTETDAKDASLGALMQMKESIELDDDLEY